MSNAHTVPAPNIANMNKNFDPVIMPNIQTHVSIQPSPNNVNTNRNQIKNSESVATEVDEHDIFGELVVREMRKMSSSTKKTFKRNVTQLLYS